MPRPGAGGAASIPAQPRRNAASAANRISGRNSFSLGAMQGLISGRGRGRTAQAPIAFVQHRGKATQRHQDRPEPHPAHHRFVVQAYRPGPFLPDGFTHRDKQVPEQAGIDGRLRHDLATGQVAPFLGGQPGHDLAVLESISNNGTAVGFSASLRGGFPAATVSYQGGPMIDLNTLLDPASGSGWNVLQTTSVNDRGEIAAGALNLATGAFTPVLLTPLE